MTAFAVAPERSRQNAQLEARSPRRTLPRQPTGGPPASGGRWRAAARHLLAGENPGRGRGRPPRAAKARSRPDALFNGIALLLEPDGRGGFLCRRKLTADPLGRVVALAPEALVLRALRPLLAGEPAELRWLLSHAFPAARRLGLEGPRLRPRWLRLRPAPPPRPAAPEALLAALGGDPEEPRRRGLPRHPEPLRLLSIGTDAAGRRHWLVPPAAAAFLAMRAAAARDGVRLEIVSSFRSALYQAELLRRKLERGLPLAAIVAVNAPPGYSEHHSGRAVDLGTPGCPPAEEDFERTAAFRWLAANAARFGFVMSYPRGNPYGFVYEPWHWCWRGSGP